MGQHELKLFDSRKIQDAGCQRVECLGLFFQNEQERREHFLEKLRDKLKDPEFRQTEGFPIGSDEDILVLSDPPYYTACPNPFIADFLKCYGDSNGSKKPFVHEPYAADVREGKTHPLYGAMAYHTKVPHRAIMRYILHYTKPGDIVLDGFCGTGMTGVAARMCADPEEVLALGYRVDAKGDISLEEADMDGKSYRKVFSRLGARQSVLVDLSPAATFIANAYCHPLDLVRIKEEAYELLQDLEYEWGWMYLTIREDNVGEKCTPELLTKELHACKEPREVRQVLSQYAASFGTINYTLWSDAYICSECGGEIVLWEEAVDPESASVRNEFPCSHCHATIGKRGMERSFVTKFDPALGKPIRTAKVLPVLINYSIGNRRHQKKPDSYDLALLDWIEKKPLRNWYPNERMPEGGESRRNDDSGITHVHHFYHHRSLSVMSDLFERSKGKCYFPVVFNMITRTNRQSSLHVRNFFRKGGGVCKGHLTGTLYIPSISPEIPVTKVFKDRVDTFLRGAKGFVDRKYLISTQSAHRLGIPDNSVDYIFLDPPFGANLNYSELNWNHESWLKVWTNIEHETIENSVQSKGILEYRHLMTACLREVYRVLRPGRWITVEFSNTKATVWNSIQTALSDVGFIVANVSALDKEQGSFKAVNTPTAVKQDLVISAYKPDGSFEERFPKKAELEEGVWDFVRTHLDFLPKIKTQGDVLARIIERDPRILFDQVVSYYVRKGYLVPISSQEFQIGLTQRFIERDGMFFLSEQADEYDRKKMSSGEPLQESLFVTDESSAIQWLRNRLQSKPQVYSKIQPEFMPLLSHLKGNERELLSLDLLLEQNFLRYDGEGGIPSQIHSYLSKNFKELRNKSKEDLALRTKAMDRWYVPDPNKAGDLEKLRERSLLKVFGDYQVFSGKRLKKFRLEVVRAGFKKAWQERDYETIIAVARKISEKDIREDSQLLMWRDHAVTRIGDDL
jgi:hypothetical protein